MNDTTQSHKPLATGPAIWPQLPLPSLAEARPHERVIHGVTVTDDYGWLRAENWREVLRDPAALPGEIRSWLDHENAFAAAHLESWSALVGALAAEMRGRIKEDDSSVPLQDGAFAYATRYREGGQHPVFCRTESDTSETILLDGDKEAEGSTCFSIGETAHSPDHTKLAWSSDRNGSESYEIRVRDAGLANDAADIVTETDGSIAWMRDGSGFYYVRLDENHRTCRVYRHRLGSSGEDALIFQEDDPAWFVDLQRLVTGDYAVIIVSDHDSNECHLLDLREPDAVPRCIEPRTPHLRYSVAQREDTLFIRTNADDAEDFKIVSCPVQDPGRGNWKDVVPHRLGRIITTFSVYPNHLVRLEREDGLPRIILRTLADGMEQAIQFEEEAFHLELVGRLTYASNILRFVYASMTTPRETYDYDLTTGVRDLRKRQVIPSGHDPSRYVTRRLYALAPDGARVPVTLLHRAELARDGRAPVLLYGYGAYGHALPASFNANALSLVDRGFVYAIAHVRGGTDKGWRWYQDGKLAHKTNTFTDLIAAGEALIQANYTRRGRIIAEGRSAGGMLMGAIANMAPDLFAGIIAGVPFVDVLNTMLDGDLPLTPPEWHEWGNPIIDPEAFHRIRNYSPYDNVAPQTYPAMLVLAGLTDPRVTYWEPAKWVARLRATMKGGGPILLKTNMGAGHAGASGRFDRLGELAEHYAFAIACAARSEDL